MTTAAMMKKPVNWKHVEATAPSIFITQTRADYPYLKLLVRDLSLMLATVADDARLLTYQEFLSAAHKSPELVNVLKGNAFWLNGLVAGSPGQRHVFRESGNLITVTTEEFFKYPLNQRVNVSDYSGSKKHPMIMSVLTDGATEGCGWRFSLSSGKDHSIICSVVLAIAVNEKAANAARDARRSS